MAQHIEFELWAGSLKRSLVSAPDLRAKQIALLEKALDLLKRDQADANVATELEAWALMQEQQGQYPSMVAAFRGASSLLRPIEH